jgi:5-methylcytosine-specific restriction endonuclease McrA
VYGSDCIKGILKVSTRKLKSNASRLREPGQSLAPAGWRGNKTSGQRGYDYEWQCYRRDYLVVHPLCAIRGDGCTLAATVVDHIRPHRGDRALFSDPENHQPACAHCHSMHKQRTEAIDNRGRVGR